jgi:hypothetical protein
MISLEATHSGQQLEGKSLKKPALCSIDLLKIAELPDPNTFHCGELIGVLQCKLV